MVNAKVHFFFEGDDYFWKLQDDIVEAQKTIDLELYHFASDAIGWHFANLLIRKASEGVQIRLIYDAFGCRWTSSSLFSTLVEKGVKIKSFNPIFPLGRPIGRRDHRKMILIDKKILFVGGYNFAAEYSQRTAGSECWRDTGIRAEDPTLTQNLEILFEKNWNGIRLKFRQFLENRQRRPDWSQSSLHAIPNHGWHQKSLIQEEYLAAIDEACDSICVTNSYFVPDHRIRRSLRRAARRGVKVRLLTPGISDVPITRWAGHATYGSLLLSGVKIFEYQGRVLHAKSAVIDGEWFTVGTFNLDYLSFFRNLEINLFGKDSSLAKQLEDQFEKDLFKSKEVTPAEWRSRSWFSQLLEKIFYWLRTWL